MYNVHPGASVPWLMTHVTSQEFIFFVGGGQIRISKYCTTGSGCLALDMAETLGFYALVCMWNTPELFLVVVMEELLKPSRWPKDGRPKDGRGWGASRNRGRCRGWMPPCVHPRNSTVMSLHCVADRPYGLQCSTMPNVNECVSTCRVEKDLHKHPMMIRAEKLHS